ncbi:MAG: aryl-sulfate sulfotransferase, partial [Ignavibacteriota bacterium]
MRTRKSFKQYLQATAIIFQLFFLPASWASSPSSSIPGIIFQSPANGDTYVPQRTTLIVRVAKNSSQRVDQGDFDFQVRGQLSGDHTGQVVIADDNETIIFKPESPFITGERVDIQFSSKSLENFARVSYSFQITPMSEAEQISRIQASRESERAEIQKQQINAALSGPDDSIKLPRYIVNVAIPDKIGEGDIFTARNGNEAYLEILDNEASPLYQFQLFNPPCQDFRPWGNKYYSYIYSEQAYLLDANHNPIRNYSCGNGYHTDDHEFQLLPNGHALLMAVDIRDTDMRIITGDPTATPHGTVIGSIFQEVDSNNNVVFQWRSWDHFEISDAVKLDIHDPNLRTIDYCHMNSLEQDADGNIIVSSRRMEEVTKINRTNGKIIWRWGGKNNMFVFAGNALPFSAQHDARRLANGHITLMDNGNYHSTTWGDGSEHDTAWSRAIEYDLDESSLLATPVWEYNNIDYTSAAGNVQRLPNGNTFIMCGPIGGQKAVEVTPDGEKVFQLSYPIGGFSYRAFRYPIPPTGSTSVSAASTETNALMLNGIYPNPAINSATLSFGSQVEGTARIEVLDILGHS